MDSAVQFCPSQIPGRDLTWETRQEGSKASQWQSLCPISELPGLPQGCSMEH